jgi:(R)-citramalate synthase
MIFFRTVWQVEALRPWKTSGKASIKKNLEELGIVLSKKDVDKVTQRVIELGDKKETVTTEDLPYIISDVLKNGSRAKHKTCELSSFRWQGD